MNKQSKTDRFTPGQMKVLREAAPVMFEALRKTYVTLHDLGHDLDLGSLFADIQDIMLTLEDHGFRISKGKD